jgi:hypothetical protein
MVRLRVKKRLQHISMVRLGARKSSNIAFKESSNDKHVCLCLRFFKKNVHNYTSIKLLSSKKASPLYAYVLRVLVLLVYSHVTLPATCIYISPLLACCFFPSQCTSIFIGIVAAANDLFVSN